MLRQIAVRNFQSVENAVLALGRLTVIVGPGDAGKSATLRAVRSAILNDGDDACIRQGAAETEVLLSFDGGELLWVKRRGKGGEYTLRQSGRGQTFTKTGGAVPEAVAAFLGVHEIAIDSQTAITPQLSDQHDPPFILGETGSRQARILGKLTRLDTVITAQMLCQKNLLAYRRRAEQEERVVAGLQERLTALPDVALLRERLRGLEALSADIQRAQELIAAIGQQDRALRARDKIALLSQRLEAARKALAEAHSLAECLAAVADAEAAYATGKRCLAEEESGAAMSRVALDATRQKYLEACRLGGVCPGCGGLRSHKNCLV